MNRIIGIDGGGCLHRAIFSSMNNPQVPATYTYLNMITGYLNKLSVTIEDKIIIAQDYGKSWRKGLDHNYKAQRKEAREGKQSPEWWKSKYSEFDRLFEQLEISVNWNFIKIWGTESDDILSMICRYYNKNEVVIISSDRDLEQLTVFDNVKVWSPITKKFKIIEAPMKVLLEKIQGDISDNLLNKPSSEAEFEIRRRIVDLTQLPNEIEQPIKLELEKAMPKNLYIHKIPFYSIQEKFRKLYKI